MVSKLLDKFPVSNTVQAMEFFWTMNYRLSLWKNVSKNSLQKYPGVGRHGSVNKALAM